MQRSTIALLFILALLLPSVESMTPAAAVTFNAQINGATGTKAVIPNYGSYVNFTSTLYATKVYSLLKYVNFSNAAITSTSNPTQTFGVATSTSGATVMIKDIQNDHIEVKEYFGSGLNPLLYIVYSMPSGISYTYPQNILITYGTFTQKLSYPYLTGASDLAGCTAPCAFLNQSNNTMIVKGLNSPDVIDLYYLPFTGSISNPAPSAVTTVTAPPSTAPTSGPSIGAAISSVGNAISSAVSNVAINLPIVTPASVGNPSFNALAEVATALVIVLIFAIGFLGRRGRTISTKASQPRMTPTHNKVASTKIRVNNRQWHPKITFLGGGGRQPRIKASSTRTPRPRPMQQTKGPKFEPMAFKRPFFKLKKRDYDELP